MKKIKLLICALLVGAVSSSVYGMMEETRLEDINPFDRQAVAHKKGGYEPLEVEMVDVTADQPSKPTSHTPWYKSKRFWYGAAAVTTVVATTAAVTYAIVSATSGEDSHHDVPNMPSVSPIPSFINNITESVTSSLSRSWSSIASHSPFPSPTPSPSWSQSLSRSLSSTFSSSMSALESMTSSVTATFSPSPSHAGSSSRSTTRTAFPSAGVFYDIWDAVCTFRNPPFNYFADCYNGTFTAGCTPSSNSDPSSSNSDPSRNYRGCALPIQYVTDPILNRLWVCYPNHPNGPNGWYYDYKNFHCQNP